MWVIFFIIFLIHILTAVNLFVLQRLLLLMQLLAFLIFLIQRKAQSRDKAKLFIFFNKFTLNNIFTINVSFSSLSCVPASTYTFTSMKSNPLILLHLKLCLSKAAFDFNDTFWYNELQPAALIKWNRFHADWFVAFSSK